MTKDDKRQQKTTKMTKTTATPQQVLSWDLSFYTHKRYTAINCCTYVWNCSITNGIYSKQDCVARYTGLAHVHGLLASPQPPPAAAAVALSLPSKHVREPAEVSPGPRRQRRCGGPLPLGPRLDDPAVEALATAAAAAFPPEAVVAFVVFAADYLVGWVVTDPFIVRPGQGEGRGARRGMDTSAPV